MAQGTGEQRVDLVFQGGGVKGVALVGAYAVLEERGFQPQNMAGASAGAIVATLAAAGYTAPELLAVMQGLDFNRFLDRGWEDRVPVAGVPLSVLKDQGIYEGEAFLAWMKEMLEAKGVVRFGDLVVDEFADDPRYRHKVSVIASDITDRRLLVLPRDAGHLGIEPDELDVALAVRMSMSIPLFFEPVRMVTPGGEHLVVDGGMLSNFPVWLFDSGGVPDWPTFGLKLVDPAPNETGDGAPPAVPVPKGPLRETVEFVAALISTMTDAHDKLYLEKADFARTITISNLGVKTTEFDLTPVQADALYAEGRRAAEEFLDERWDFDAYIASFRSGREVPGRHTELAAELRSS